MSDEVLWSYKGQGAYIDGVPARNLTAADLARMSIDDLSAVENSGLYRRAPQKKEEDPLPEREGVDKVDAVDTVAPKKSNKKE